MGLRRETTRPFGHDSLPALPIKVFNPIALKMAKTPVLAVLGATGLIKTFPE